MHKKSVHVFPVVVPQPQSGGGHAGQKQDPHRAGAQGQQHHDHVDVRDLLQQCESEQPAAVPSLSPLPEICHFPGEMVEDKQVGMKTTSSTDGCELHRYHGVAVAVFPTYMEAYVARVFSTTHARLLMQRYRECVCPTCSG